MTDLITEARELCEMATPGPWERRNASDVFTELGADNGNGAYAAQNDAWQIADCDPASGTDWCIDTDADGGIAWGRLKSQANAAFIARSRTLIPELCDALEKAEDKIESIHKALDFAETQRQGSKNYTELAINNGLALGRIAVIVQHDFEPLPAPPEK